MKSERRHELKTNTLALAMERLPEAGRKYLGQVLMGIIIALLVFFLVRYRINASHQANEGASQNLASARSMITDLRNAQWWRAPQEQISQMRRNMSSDANTAIDRVLADSKDRRSRAEALIARGDLNLALGSFPDLPAATTRPFLALDQDHAQLIAAAAEAYQKVLDEYTDQKAAGVSAHFGLAAIAEDKSDWDSATKHYTAIKNQPDVPKSLLDQAEHRLDMLAKLREPIYLAPATSPTTMAVVTTLPETIAAPAGPNGPTPPTSTATTQPATQPAP